MQAEKGQDRHHDDDQSDKIDDRVHRYLRGNTGFTLNAHNSSEVAPPERLPHGGV